MADSVSARYDLKLIAAETVDLALDQAANPTTDHKIDGVSGTLDANSTVPATKTWSDDVTLTAGAKTHDLGALDRTSLGEVNFTGLKVQLLKILAADTNTETVTFADGAANPYFLFGDVNGQITLDAGMACLFYYNDKLPNVSVTASEVDVSSSDADAKYKIIMVAG